MFLVFIPGLCTFKPWHSQVIGHTWFKRSHNQILLCTFLFKILWFLLPFWFSFGRSYCFQSCVIHWSFEKNEQRKGQTIVLWYVISFLWNGYVYVIANILDFYDFTLDFEPCDLLWFFLDKKYEYFCEIFFSERMVFYTFSEETA